MEYCQQPEPRHYGSELSVSLLTSLSDIWAVGHSGQEWGIDALTLIEHWDGSAWSIIDGPNPGFGGGTPLMAWLSYLLVMFGPLAQIIKAVNSGEATLNLIERWDGSNWNIVPSLNDTGVVGYPLNGVSGAAANDVWAVGCICYHPTIQNIETLIEHWDGTNWNVVPIPPTGGNIPSRCDSHLDRRCLVSGFQWFSWATVIHAYASLQRPVRNSYSNSDSYAYANTNTDTDGHTDCET